jgi:DNA-binding YbaB/EbfC family protein
MKQRLAGAQADLESVRVVGEAGAGLVRVVMNGKHEVVELKIEPRTMVPSEVALVEDLIRAAVNQASQKVGEAARERMNRMAQNLGLDPSMLAGLGL